MERFQVQGQWENENALKENHNSESLALKKPVVVNVSKRMLAIISVSVFLLVAIMLAIYTFGRTLEGTWIRQQDDNTPAVGMVVEVSKVNGIWQGEIIAMGTDTDMFKVGQIKWHNIRKVGFGQYECSDLIGLTDTSENYYDGSTSVIKVLNGGNELTLTASSPYSSGKYQVWVKQK